MTFHPKHPMNKMLKCWAGRCFRFKNFKVDASDWWNALNKLRKLTMSSKSFCLVASGMDVVAIAVIL